MQIDGRNIGKDYPPYVIAELSANHNGSIETALNLINQARIAGASAVKLQTYTPDTITLDVDSEEFRIQGGLWDGRTLYELYAEAHTPWEWHKVLFDYANDIGITIFTSPFDTTAIDLLENLNAPAYKIASFECIDLPLIRAAASTGKPLIISTGMANESEINDAVETALKFGSGELALLHCVSGYPAPAQEYNLLTLKDMREKFGVTVGLSDHTLSNTTAVAAVALGATLIEKHVTLDRSGGGPDDSFSLEENDLEDLCTVTKTAWAALGTVNYERTEAEKGNVKFRRSLYFVRDLKQGDIITQDCVRSVRPGFGLAPKHLDAIIGAKLNRDVSANTPVKTEVFESILE